MKEYTVRIRPLTPIWTGDENRKNTTLRETGIIGSLRWWYEVLIRGLGGSACDPTDTKCDGKNHCDACELFGCTGWARKFRLEIKITNQQVIAKFIELREIKDIEWALLNNTIRIISEYGAIGAKIADPNYGLIEMIEIEKDDLAKFTLKKEELNNCLRKKGNGVNNPNLERFVFIKEDLKYETVKKIKDELSFLKGNKAKGKRYFYKTYKNKPHRYFAYAENDNEYKEMIKFLKEKSVKFIEGKRILEGLK